MSRRPSERMPSGRDLGNFTGIFVNTQAIRVPIRRARPKMLNKLKRNDILVYDFRCILDAYMKIRSARPQYCKNGMNNTSKRHPTSHIGCLDCTESWGSALRLIQATRLGWGVLTFPRRKNTKPRSGAGIS